MPSAAPSNRVLHRQLSGAVFIAAHSPGHVGAREGVIPAVPRAASRRGAADSSSAGLRALLRPAVLRATRARLLPQRRLLLAKGTFIDCTLETAIDSTLPGMTTCVTATDTFSADGEVVLLERGTQLVGIRGATTITFMGGGGSLALNQLLVTMDGINEPPFKKKFVTNRLNTFLDALYVVPRRIGPVSMRLRPPKPRKEAIYFIGSCNVPLDTLGEHRAALRAHLDDPVVLVCRSGMRAVQAERSFADVGMDNVHVLAGGMAAASGLPCYANDESF